jgi:predicted PurR-regulated permease PerM
MSGTDRIVAFAGVIGAGFVLYLLAPILTPFIASALLAYLGDPLVDRLERIRMPRTLAVLAVFVWIFVVLGALTLLIIPLVRAQASALIEHIPEYLDWIESQMPRVQDALGMVQSAANGDGYGALFAQHRAELSGLASGALKSVSRSGGALITGILSLLLVPVITFYLLRDWDLLIARVAALVPERRRPIVWRLARQSDEVLGGFFRGQLLVVLGLALIYSVGLLWVGLDFALAIGVLSGLVSFVPYLGLFVGITLASIAALVQIGTLTSVGAVVLVFVVGQLIEGTFLTPKLVGDRIGLHPVIVIFAVLAGGQLFGFMGILLALPAAAVLSVMVRIAMEHYRAPPAAPAPPDVETG